MALPSEYKLLDYIEGTGTQYIDTGLQTSTKRKLELGFSINNKSRDNIYGSGGSNNTSHILYSIRAGTSYSTFRVYQRPESPGAVDTNVPIDTLKHDVVIDEKNGTIEFDGVSFAGYQPTGTTSFNEYIFAYNAIGTINNTYTLSGKVYYAKYYEDDVLVRDFVPVKRMSDAVLGMYDLVNDVFYTNAGSGVFYGSEYIELGYLQSSGSQYIATEKAPSTTGKIEMAFEPRLASSRQMILASWNSNSAVNYFVEQTAENVLGITVSGVSKTDYVAQTLSVGTRYDYVWDLINGEITVNGNHHATISGTPTSSYDLYAFASHDSSSNPFRPATARIYYLRFYDLAGTLVQDYTPKVRSDGTLGFYDEARNIFKTRSGSGTFNYGIKVDPEINIAGAGTITGTGIYPSGDTVTLGATANQGFEFVNWKLLGYTKLDYIESSGTAQYIDTGVKPSDYVMSLRIEGDMAWNTSPQGTSVSQFLFGTGYYNSTTTSRRTICVGYNQALDQDHMTYLNGAQVGAGVTFTGSSLDTTRRIYGIDQVNKVYIYGDQTQAFTTTVNSNLTKSILIFAYRNSSQSGEPVLRWANAKCYGFKIWNNDTLLRDYIPVKRDFDGSVGLYDLVNGKFYANAGTGTFSYGQELGELEIESNPLIITSDYFVDNIIANFKHTANCRFKLNDEWKYGMMYKKVNGEWVTGSVYTKVNGNWETLSNPQTRMLNMALSTVLGNDISVKDPNLALNIIMKGE